MFDRCFGLMRSNFNFLHTTLIHSSTCYVWVISIYDPFYWWYPNPLVSSKVIDVACWVHMWFQKTKNFHSRIIMHHDVIHLPNPEIWQYRYDLQNTSFIKMMSVCSSLHFIAIFIVLTNHYSTNSVIYCEIVKLFSNDSFTNKSKNTWVMFFIRWT